MNRKDHDASLVLGQPLDLPCGVRLKNRLIKSAMSDSLGDGAGNPTEAQMRLYERWAEGGAALSLMGEVQTSPHHPEKPGNLVLVPDADMQAMQALADRASVNGAHVWPQLGHAGALAHAPISEPKGPSPLNIGGLKCDGMSLEDIHELPATYARAASLAREAGFGGVQIHAGHGSCSASFCHPCSITEPMPMEVRSSAASESSVKSSTPYDGPSGRRSRSASRSTRPTGWWVVSATRRHWRWCGFSTGHRSISLMSAVGPTSPVLPPAPRAHPRRDPTSSISRDAPRRQPPSRSC